MRHSADGIPEVPFWKRSFRWRRAASAIPLVPRRESRRGPRFLTVSLQTTSLASGAAKVDRNGTADCTAASAWLCA
jgi:hypothetical protein